MEKFYCMVAEYRFWIVCRGSYIRKSQTLIEPGRKSISNCDREGPSKKVECNQWEIEGRGVGWVELNHGEIWYCKGP